MTAHPLRTVACDEAACAQIHAATLEVLEKTGVEVQHEDALESLRAAGAVVDGTRVRMPAAMVSDALAAAPKAVALASRPGGGPSAAGGEPAARESGSADGGASRSRAIELRVGQTYYGTGSDCLYLLGPGTRDRRPVTLSDVEEFAALQEKLPNIEFVMSMAHPVDQSPAVADAAQFAAMLRGTGKPLLMVTPEAEALPAMKEMAAACGAADSWGIYAMPTPPLVHGHDSVEILIRCAQLDVPMAYATALLPGATAPASRAGFVVVSNAETLSGLVITQLAKPGAPYVYGLPQGSMNMRTSQVLYNAPESYAMMQAGADLARFYGLPSFGYGGCSDSPLLDEQWALEAGLSLLANAMSGVTLLHDLGYVASGTASSFESVGLMDEVVRWVKTYLQGVSVDPEELAIEEIAAVGPGGTHLGRKYTRAHYRRWMTPALLSQQPYDAWASAGGHTLLDRVAAKTRELREGARGYELEADVVAELDRLVDGVRRLREGS